MDLNANDPRQGLDEVVAMERELLLQHEPARHNRMSRMVSIDTGPAVFSTPEEKSASVLNNNVLAFNAGLSRQDKQYIKNSLCWAESRADLLYNRKTHPAAWFEHYSGVLWSVGWSLEHSPVEIIDTHYSGGLVEHWSKALSTQLSRAKRNLMKETFGVLEHDLQALRGLSACSQKSGDFRFLPSEYNRLGELEMVVTQVRLIRLNWRKNYLFWEVEHPQSQLDIRARRFSASVREMGKYRESLDAAVKAMKLVNIEADMNLLSSSV